PGAERIARALHDEGRAAKILEMGSAQSVRRSRRMERIAKANKAGDATGSMQFIRHHGGDARAKRLASDQQPAWPDGTTNGGAVLAQQRLGARRRLALARAPRRHVGEFEAGRAYALLRELARHRVHPVGVHWRARAVREEQRKARIGRTG